LHRLAGDDGDIEATVVTAAPPLALAVAPDGRHVYSVEDGRVVRRDATTGVAQRSSDPISMSDVLAAAPAGPWVAVAEGDGLALLDAERLEETARPDRADTGYGVAVGQRTLWAVAADGLYCADLTTGRLQAQEPQGPRATEVAADGAGAYLNTIDEAPDRSGLYVVEPDAACGW
jgi:outer membrane protein assembly factor BamB